MAVPDHAEFELVGPVPEAPGAGHYPSRTKARKAALDILFEADARGVSALAVWDERLRAAETPLRELTTEIVRGWAENADELDDLISDCLMSGWTFDRMPAVDRNLCRIAAFEVMHSDTPAAVAASDAVRLAGDLSTDGSASFVNAIVAEMIRRHRDASSSTTSS